MDGALPASDEVHVWLVDVARMPLDGTLAPDERERASRLRREEDRRRSVVSRMSLRRILGDYLGVPHAALQITTRCLHCDAQHGKPRLAAQAAARDLRFNTSHSGNVVVHAFALGREVGIDVEADASAAGWREVSGQYFSADEQARLASAPDESVARRRFLETWTQKEAVLKLTGLGLAGPLEKVGTAQAARDGIEVRPLAELPAGYTGAVAAPSPLGRVRWFHLP